MRRVYVDTSVLFPFSVMDLVLALAEDSVHHVLWTDELLDEWEDVIVREHQRSADSAASVTAAIREFFDDSRIDPALYRGRIDRMPGPDPDDHIHSAAAIAAGADVLITWDKSGFPAVKGNTELVKIAKGDSLALRFAIYTHTGDVKSGQVDEAYKIFAK